MICSLTMDATNGLVRFRACASLHAGEELIDQVVFRLINAANASEQATLNRLVNTSLKEVGLFQNPNGAKGFATLFNYLQNPPAVAGAAGKSVGGYVIEVFREKALTDITARELFFTNVFEADRAGVPNLGVLLRRVNGVTSVQGTYYPLAIVKMLEPGFAGVSVEVVGATTTPLDAVLAKPADTSVLGGVGKLIAAEFKTSTSLTSPPDMHTQGLDYLNYLVTNLQQDPRLFRFIHNVDPAIFPSHEADQATKFMVDILGAAKDTQAFGHDAAGAVVTELSSAGISGVSQWDPGTVVGKYASLTPDEQAAARLIRKWFYIHYDLPGIVR